MKRRFAVLPMAAALAISLLAVLAAPALAQSIPGAYTFDISEGSITVQSSPNYPGRFEVFYGASQSLDGISPLQQITIIGSSTTNTVEVSVNGTANIILEDVSITSSSVSPFSIGSDAAVNLTVDGANTLDGSSGSNAGLAVPSGAALEITVSSTGSLTATGGSNGSAGIGSAGSGGNSGSGGTVTINGGSVKATGGENGAGVVGSGIGGGGSAAGNSGSGGTVTINGGSVKATGGSGIGGGSGVVGGNGGAVTINGGSVTATGNGPGSGIGGGCGTVGGNGGAVTINGGSVTASGGNGNGGAGIGGGGGSMGGPGSGGTVTINGGSVTANSIQSAVYNSSNAQEYLATVAGLPSGASVSYTVNGGSAVSCATYAGGNLYLWLPNGVQEIAITASGVQYKASGTVTTGSNNFTVRTPGTTFSDVPSNCWAYGAIESLVGQGIVSGYPGGAFKPDNPVTRVEFCACMDKALKLPAYSPGNPTFSDVSPSDWFDASVEAVAHAGIVTGYGDGAFKPESNITREELACVLVQALGQQNQAMTDMNAKTSFTDDGGISYWARGFVVVAVKDGLLNGYPDGSFRPQGYATRAEDCAMIESFLNYSQKK